MDDHLETRVRFVGAGVQTSVFGLAIVEYSSAGFALVLLGTLVTLWGIV
ncbi:hypothetical protein M0R88_15030 [Halorussus gelatinilyticus]|uniref:Uncharacterized protein n=1 Tax=Halorussus gelatinilyticus TaxID=2937524 RepID=A0A8U0IGL0_9EURY|nr:hypothetical protein [Halorussus gelatinilyticus]UPV99820.1 hypothetical protein M0R88_15030 [Halorussus gelatinilyticus]